jgi:GH25 family lysozyme M1 (1,4-beta-N-acetylmuramidase)
MGIAIDVFIRGRSRRLSATVAMAAQLVLLLFVTDAVPGTLQRHHRPVTVTVETGPTSANVFASAAAPPPAAVPVSPPQPKASGAQHQAAPPQWQPAHPRADYMGATIAAYEHWVLSPGTPATIVPGGTAGIDVSHWQGRIDWTAVSTEGVKFAYIKATEATTYTDPSFAANFAGASDAGVIRGAYHFAVPNASSGSAQANYLVDNGGTWAADGRTLPPALDIEYNPYGADPCYGLSAAQMRSWVADFVNTVYDRTGRWPVIYTTANWWSRCTANSPYSGANSPLWIASWNNSSHIYYRPAGWSTYTFWQYADRGVAPGDQDVFNGTLTQLRAFAVRSDRPTNSTPSTSPVTTPHPGVGTLPGGQPPPTTVPPAPSPSLPSTPSSVPVKG